MIVYGCTWKRVSIDGEYSSKIFDTDPSVVPGDLYTIALTRPRVTCRRYTTLQNSGLLDHCKVCHGSVKAMLILDTVDVQEACSHIASRHHSVQWHVRSHGWCDASFGYDQHWVQRRFVLCCEVSSTEGLQIIHWSDSNDGQAPHFGTYPHYVRDVIILQKVGHGNGN